MKKSLYGSIGVIPRGSPIKTKFYEPLKLGPLTFMLNLNNFSTPRTILDLKMSLDRAQDPKLCLKMKSKIYIFTIVGINELLYPYAVRPDLLQHIFMAF